MSGVVQTALYVDFFYAYHYAYVTAKLLAAWQEQHRAATATATIASVRLCLLVESALSLSFTITPLSIHLSQTGWLGQLNQSTINQD